MFAHRAFLLDVTDRVPRKNTLAELVDILARFRYNRFYLYAEGPLPEGALDLARLDAYCQMQGLECVRLDHAAWEREFLSGHAVTASTECPRSLAGRVEEMRLNMERAEENGRRHGADTFVVTDFSDGYAWQPIAASLPGIVLGGNFASAGRSSAKMDLERDLNGVLGVPLGGMLLRLGTLYLRGGALREDSSEYFNILAHDHGYSRHPNITQAVLDDVSGIAHGVRIAAERWIDRSPWATEIAYMSMLLDAACHRRDETRLRLVRDMHGQIWRARFLDEGRVESLARLPRF